MIARLAHDTDEQWSALVYLAEHPTMTMAELAGVIGKQVSTVKSWCTRGAWRARLKEITPTAAPVPVSDSRMQLGQLQACCDASSAAWREEQKRFPLAEPPKGLPQLFALLLRAEESARKIDALEKETNPHVEDSPDYSSLSGLQFFALSYLDAAARGHAARIDDDHFARLVNAGDAGEAFAQLRHERPL